MSYRRRKRAREIGEPGEKKQDNHKKKMDGHNGIDDEPRLPVGPARGGEGRTGTTGEPESEISSETTVAKFWPVSETVKDWGRIQKGREKFLFQIWARPNYNFLPGALG